MTISFEFGTAVARRLEQALELCPVLVVLKGQIVCLRSESQRLWKKTDLSCELHF